MPPKFEDRPGGPGFEDREGLTWDKETGSIAYERAITGELGWDGGTLGRKAVQKRPIDGSI